MHIQETHTKVYYPQLARKIVSFFRFIHPSIVSLMTRYRNPHSQSLNINKQLDNQTNNIQNGVVYFGDSDIFYWNTPPHRIKIGVWGAEIEELATHAKKLKTTYNPNMLIMVGGANDFLVSKTADTIIEYTLSIFREFAHIPIIYMGTKPEPISVSLYAQYKKYDDLVKNYIYTNKANIYYVDNSDMTDTNLYCWDGLHLNDSGYQLWNTKVSTILNSFEKIYS